MAGTRVASADLPRSAAGRHSPWTIAVIISIATFMEVLDTTIANVSLRHIAGGLAISEDESTWVLTSYLVSNAIVLPISGWLSNVVGRKRFYMTCVALFALSSLLCGLSTSLAMIVTARIIQGLGGGGLAPTEQSMLADSFPPAKRPAAFALYSATVVLAPAIGPVLGGLITDNLTWRWIFFINVPIGIISLVLVHLYVAEAPAVVAERKRLLSQGFHIDVIGFALVALGFGALQVVLDRGERDDWFGSSMITALIITSAVALITLVFWELRQRVPMVNIGLFRLRSFSAACVVMFAIFVCLLSSTQLLPEMTQSLMGYDVTTAGLTLGLGGIATLAGVPVAGIIMGRTHRPRYLVAFSLALTGIALAHMSHLDLLMSFWDVSVARMLQAVALPFTFVAITAASYVGIPPDKNNEASAIINLTRNLGGSFGVSLSTTMLDRRQQFHHARLAEHITAMTQLGHRSIASIAHAIDTQASVMSYLDDFYLLSLVAFICIPVAFLLRDPPKGAVSVGH